MNPDYTIKPGEILKEYLESYSMTVSQLSRITGLTKKTINNILKGEKQISNDTSIMLELAFDRPASLWNNLQKQYNKDKKRLKII